MMDTANSKVSIVLPTYNGARYLRQSIDSCLDQTYSNLELIIVDDCSTDATPDIVRSYQDPRIRYFRHEKNKMLPGALNTGFSYATGAFLTWTSDDNYYVPKAIETMVKFLSSGRHDFVYCDYFAFRNAIPGREKPPQPILMELPDTPSVERGNRIGACFLYTRKVYEAIGNYDEAMPLAEDYDYWIRVSKRFSMGHLHQALYYYRDHGKSLYVTRLCEATAMGILAQLKHGVQDARGAARLFSFFMAERMNKACHFKGSTTLYRFYGWWRYSRRMISIFSDFQKGRLEVQEAQKALVDLVKKYHDRAVKRGQELAADEIMGNV